MYYDACDRGDRFTNSMIHVLFSERGDRFTNSMIHVLFSERGDRFTNRCVQMISWCWPEIKTLSVGGKHIGKKGLLEIGTCIV